jgi:hypothetical protein
MSDLIRQATVARYERDHEVPKAAWVRVLLNKRNQQSIIDGVAALTCSP